MKATATADDEIYGSHARILSELRTAGTLSMTCALSAFERQSMTVGDTLSYRYPHVMCDSRHHLPSFARLGVSVHRLIVRNYLLDIIPNNCDQIIEIGAGVGENLFNLWLSGAPKCAEYVSLEPSRVGRRVSIDVAALAAGLNFRAAPFDARETADFHYIVTGQNAFVFTCGTLITIPILSDRFFDDLLEAPGISSGAHFERGAWQLRTSPINAEAGAWDCRTARNTNWLKVLAEAHRRKILVVDDFIENSHSPGPPSAMSIISWSRHGNRKRFSLGEHLPLKTNADEQHWRRTGWSWAESEGRLTDGPEAHTSIALAETPKAPVTLVVKAKGFCTRWKRVGVRVTINNLPLTRWNVGSTVKEFRVSIPAHHWQPFGIADIRFHVEEYRAENDSSTDPRQLGICISEMHVD